MTNNHFLQEAQFGSSLSTLSKYSFLGLNQKGFVNSYILTDHAVGILKSLNAKSPAFHTGLILVINTNDQRHHMQTKIRQGHNVLILGSWFLTLASWL